MSGKISKMREAFREGAKNHRTWSGLPLKTYYTSEDLSDLDLENQAPAPGEYPYTRGIHEDMYRGKYWTRREVCGYGTGEVTSREWGLCSDPPGNAGYVEARETVNFTAPKGEP